MDNSFTVIHLFSFFFFFFFENPTRSAREHIQGLCANELFFFFGFGMYIVVSWKRSRSSQLAHFLTTLFASSCSKYFSCPPHSKVLTHWLQHGNKRILRRRVFFLDMFQIVFRVPNRLPMRKLDARIEIRSLPNRVINKKQQETNNNNNNLFFLPTAEELIRAIIIIITQSLFGSI